MSGKFLHVTLRGIDRAIERNYQGDCKENLDVLEKHIY